MNRHTVSTGIPGLDEVLQGLRLGDNVVWQVDNLEDYRYFAEPFAREGIKRGRDVVYIRFSEDPPVLAPQPGLETLEVDPSQGFDYFSRTVNEIIEKRGTGVLYVLDNLSALVAKWATDELLANFFQVTCPYLFEFDTVTYFALTRGRHAYSAVARIRDTTQVLIDVSHVKDRMYLHPLKVWDRYSPNMYLPHVVSGDDFIPVAQSGDAAEVAAMTRRTPLRSRGSSTAPWEIVFHRLEKYRGEYDDSLARDPEFTALKQELIRMLIGSDPQFAGLAQKYFTLKDLTDIRERLIGSGRIGGKAAGMLLARAILRCREDERGLWCSQQMEGHDSFYIGSDVFFTFLVNNNLFRLRQKMTKSSRLSQKEFEEVEHRFLEGSFRAEIMGQFRDMLDYFGQAPIIVRSSSLLEDSIGNAFAGKYRSEFCANQGDPDQRLESFLRAVRLVYASTLNPDALSYRRKRGLGESDEQMAILVQRVSGTPHGGFFFPTLAGVAFSRNLYAWSDRIDPRKGIIRLVYGLGTRAVERVSTDYPRMIAVSHPELRPEEGLKVARYSQRNVDLIDLESNRLNTLPVADVFSKACPEELRFLISVRKGDYLQDPHSNFFGGKTSDYFLTFNNLIAGSEFVKSMGRILSRLEEAYGLPVDTEFTASVNEKGEIRVNLLQCRPLFFPGASAAVNVNVDLPPERVLFRSSTMIGGGEVSDIRYILYIAPHRYSAVTSDEIKRSIGRVVGRINEHPVIMEGRVMMMGPGRWGSSNIDLGVNVGYADIDNAEVLVEIAREEAGHMPELSYGTHFFQDLVEARIIFLAIFPDDPACGFNSAFFERSPNILTEIIPDAGKFTDVIHLIDTKSAAGAPAHVVADARRHIAQCYLEVPAREG